MSSLKNHIPWRKRSLSVCTEPGERWRYICRRRRVGGGVVIEIDEGWRLSRRSGLDGSPRLRMRREFSQPPASKSFSFYPELFAHYRPSSWNKSGRNPVIFHLFLRFKASLMPLSWSEGYSDAYLIFPRDSKDSFRTWAACEKPWRIRLLDVTLWKI